ncbi:MAG: acetate--CoA ligase [Desulfovibrio sp.]|jgi:acetyl-CoA synthetase|nr:acetate--CoA ligase [Desulfovibrio sp.]
MDERPTLDTLLREERVIRPLPQFTAEANLKPLSLLGLRERAEADPLGYWEEAAEELEWFRTWDRVLTDGPLPERRWFPGARCNIAYNALDRHIQTPNKNKLALIWEGEPGDTRKYTYFELHREVNRFANALRRLGVRKGDCVGVYLPALPEAVVTMLACARIGAVHAFVFAGYSAKALRQRLEDCRPRVLVTADGSYRDGRVLRHKDVADRAVEPGPDADAPLAGLPMVVVRRTGADVSMRSGLDHWYEALVREERKECPVEVLEAGDPLFYLYTSGASSRPHGVVHCHGGYMVGVHRTFHQVFDVKPTDIFWCTADPGWIMGHTATIYGPLLAGTTTVLYEGHPNYPRPDRLWNIVERYGVSLFYSTPTTIRTLMRFGHEHPARADLSSLRLLASAGEPLDPETWTWLHKHIGNERCPVLDVWWQTETGMFMVSPLPVSVVKPGSVARALPGVQADVVDLDGGPVERGEGGFLVIRTPWPAMMTGILGHDDAFRACFNRVPGVYFAGDLARLDEDGYIWVKGRSDEVLLIAGHRIGTADFEEAFISHPAVAEVAVVGVPDPIKGETARAFVVLAPDYDPEDELREQLLRHVREELGPIAVISGITFRESLPRTGSGKILRRALRS